MRRTRATAGLVLLTVALMSLLAARPVVGASPDAETRSSHIGRAVVVGDELFFIAYETPRGATLWRSDGTKRGTRLVRDIRPNDGPRTYFRPRDWYQFDLSTSFGKMLLFVIDDGVHGAELWRSDGSRQRTRLVKDIRRGGAGSSPSVLAVLGDRIILTANDGVHGRELWTSDGTKRGTRLLKDVRRGNRGIIPEGIPIVLGDQLFFVANDGARGSELWVTDGTRKGTRLVRDIRPGPKGADLEDFVVLDGALYFFADDGVHGQELWRSDGTRAGTVLLKDLDPGPESFQHQLCPISEDADRFLIAMGAQIWTSDGTADGTALVTAKASNTPRSLDVESCRPAGDGRGAYLSGLLLDDQYDDLPGYGLWWSDGTVDGTIEVATFLPESGEGPDLQSAPILDGKLVFAGDDGGRGWEPWISDGTPSGTGMILDINPEGSGIGPAFYGAGFMQKVGDVIYLSADEGINGEELWVTDGTPSGTRLVRDINPDGSSNPFGVASVDEVLFFIADDGTHGRELWRSDGTEAGTRLVRDINRRPQK